MAEGASATDYLNISALGLSALSPSGIVYAFLGCFKNIFFALVDKSSGQAPTLYSILNIIFAVAFSIGTIAVILKIKLWQKNTVCFDLDRTDVHDPHFLHLAFCITKYVVPTDDAYLPRRDPHLYRRNI